MPRYWCDRQCSGRCGSNGSIRMLKAIGFKPRRTIRIALWAVKSKVCWAHVSMSINMSHHALNRMIQPIKMSHHFYASQYQSIGLQTDARQDFRLLQPRQMAVAKSVVSTQRTMLRVKAIFDSWLAPFHDLGAKTTTMKKTGSTDHVSFDAVGVPGFQFIQEPMDYFTRTHHTNIDVYDKVQKGDMMQASMIMASLPSCSES